MKVLKRQKDSRGWIEFCEAEGCKFNVLFSKAGSYRSGDYHPRFQRDMILSGEVEIREVELDAQGRVLFDETITLYGRNESLIILPGTAHLFCFKQDTLMIEWWDGEFEAKYYRPYRDIVDKSLEPKP